MAGSSMTFTEEKLGTVRKILIDWTSDDTTGTVAGTTTFPVIGFIYKGVTDPGAPAPTTDYDIDLTEPEGTKILGASADDLLDRSATVTEVVHFDLASGVYPSVSDLLTVTVSNAGNSKQGQIILYYGS